MNPRLAFGLRRDLARCHQRIRAADCIGDDRAAFVATLEAEQIEAEIASAECVSLTGLRAEPRLAEMWV